MLLRRLAVPALLLALLVLPVPGAGATTAHRSWNPTYTWSYEPSPVVLLLPERMVRIRPYVYCWEAPPETTPDGEIGSSVCADGIAPKRSELPKVARTGQVRFWFGRPGWRWSARMVSFAHPRRAGCAVRRTPVPASARRFDLAPPRYRGTYRVSLFGQGPEGDVSVDFSWRYGVRRGRCS